ncbi:MAG: endonuclease/exonuclease/phosphatase family protein [Candidatus Thiodiazotropha sp.]
MTSSPYRTGECSDTTKTSNDVCSSKFEKLRCASLNVCGIKRRVNYPEFCELVQEHDIFCVAETKLDKHDTVQIEGYTFLSQSRKQPFLRRSGGIGVFVKASISPYVTIIESDSDYILWFKISKKFLRTDEDIVCGAIYVPPSDSKYNTPDELDMFEVEITNMCILQKYVFLMGDFNSRTHNKEDFTDVDTFFANHFDFDDIVYQFYNSSLFLDKFGFDKIRSSKDKG